MAIPEREVNPESDEDFKIDNDQLADWALEKIKEIKEKKQEKKEFAEEKIRQVKQWLEEELSKLDNDIEFFEGALAEYAVQLKEENEDLKTHSLPAGKLQFRKQRPKWKYHKNMLLNSLKKAGRDDLIRIKESIDKRKLKKQVEVVGNQIVDPKTGQIIDGVEVQERGEKFKVKVND